MSFVCENSENCFRSYEIVTVNTTKTARLINKHMIDVTTAHTYNGNYQSHIHATCWRSRLWGLSNCAIVFIVEISCPKVCASPHKKHTNHATNHRYRRCKQAAAEGNSTTATHQRRLHRIRGMHKTPRHTKHVGNTSSESTAYLLRSDIQRFGLGVLG